ncbi:hypothetical protein B0H13DRAFT_2306174 [Mycena leptocephala]|nr:hypothetical protein B0H13DRAFT_2306174 [Mycena leptocephala]
MALEERDPDKVTIKAFFLDELHGIGSQPHVTLKLNSVVFRNLQVSRSIFVKSAWLLEDIPDATATYSGVDHDPVNGIEFMVSESKILDYEEIAFKNEVIVLCECSSDRTDKLFNIPKSKEKRQRDPSEDAPDATHKDSKLELPSRVDGLCIIPLNDNPAAPIGLLPPSFAFSSCIERSGIAFIDKTKFISVLDALLNLHTGCFAAFPPKTGKTALMSMMSAWLDCELEENKWRELFEVLPSNIQFKMAELQMMAEVEKDLTQWQRLRGTSPRLFLCRISSPLRLREADLSAATSSIDIYLLNTIQEFIFKYQAKLGAIEFSSEELNSPVKMITKLLKQVSRKFTWRSLFIGVDHWDAPVLRSLSLQNDALTRKLARHITVFLTALTAPGQSKVAKLLVFGNLPLFQFGNTGAHTALTNIILNSKMEGALGMTSQELELFFSVLSLNRHITLDPKEDGLMRKLGHFSLPPSLPNGSPLNVFNFELVLNHVARILSLDSGHKALADSTVLTQISQRCEHFLRYSSLGRDRQMVIPPIHGLDLTSATSLLKSEEDLWKWCFYLGVLRVVDPVYPGKAKPDAMWTIEVGNLFAAKNLFSRFPISLKFENDREIQLRALLERNPRPFMEALADRLESRPLRSLFDMREAGFQEMLDSFMEDDLTIPADKSELKTKRRKSKYQNNYFSQVGLLTDFAKHIKLEAEQREQEAAQKQQQSTKGKGKQPANRQVKRAPDAKPKISGLDAFGYLDALLVALRDLHPGRVIALELKYISLICLLWKLYKDDVDKTREECIRGPGGKMFEGNCLGKVNELAKKSMAELMDVDYMPYNSERLYKVGPTLDNAVKQLRSYMDAIVQGNANQGFGEPRTEGITNGEKRIAANQNQENPVDEVVGYVVCGIGRRIITIAVQPTRQNTRYRYDAIPGWQDRYER